MRSLKRCLCASLLAFSLVCAGCLPQPAGALLPEPPDVDITWVGGEASALRSLPAVIYVADNEGERLMPSSVYVTMLANETYAEALLKVLMEAQWQYGDAPLITAIEESRDVITVDFEGGLGGSEREVFVRARAIAKTLTGISGVNYVNILTGGTALAFGGLPQGALSSPSNDTLDDFYLMSGTMFTRGDQARQSAYNVTLYFPTAQGGWLMPETRRVDMSAPADAAQDASSFLAPIITELLQGPRSLEGLSAVAPEADTLSDVTVDTFGDGTRIVRVSLTGDAMRHVSRGLINEKQLAGAIVLTVTTFLPGVSAVSIEIDGRQMQTLDAEFMPSGWMQRKLFEGLIAKPLALYFPDAGTGRLVRAERPVSAASVISPSACARELFAGDKKQDGIEIDNALPHLMAEDILGALILDDTLYLNLSDAAYGAMRAIDEEYSRLCIYAVINTMIDNTQVKRVQLLINGCREDAIAARVFTGAPLMKRSGME